MTEKQLKSVMDSITMPEAMAQELRKNVSGKKQKNRTFRYPKIAQEFDENPLADSFNYKLTVELSANTKEVREAIENVEGVRMVSDLSELK